MKRLTISKYTGEHAQLRDGIGIDHIQILIDRLGEYEDTGLTPEGIKIIKKEDERTNQKNFPILGSKESIPLKLISPHENQAIINHMQTLQRLSERGGLDWTEALAVLEDREYKRMDRNKARTEVLKLLSEFRDISSDSELNKIKMINYDGEPVPEELCTVGRDGIADDFVGCGDCFKADSGINCSECVVDRIFKQYALLTNQKVGE